RSESGAARAMPGVKAILTADDLPAPRREAGAPPGPLAPEAALTNEPVYKGEPILGVAAVDEHTAAEAVDRIELDLEPLPFLVDPLDSLRPNGPNAWREGNAFVGGKRAAPEWAAPDFGRTAERPMAPGEARTPLADGVTA